MSQLVCIQVNRLREGLVAKFAGDKLFSTRNYIPLKMLLPRKIAQRTVDGRRFCEEISNSDRPVSDARMCHDCSWARH